MKRILAVILSGLTAAAALCACAPQNAQQAVESAASAAASAVSEAAAGATDAATEAATEAATDGDTDNPLFSWTFQLDGKELTLPCDFSELAAMGYTLSSDEDLNANTYTIGVYAKKEDGSSLHLQIWNPTDEKKPMADCKVGQIEVDLDDNLPLTLAGGFVFDDTVTPESVKAKYGEPDYENEGDGYVVVKYQQDVYATVEFFIYTDETMLKYSHVTIENMES